MDNSSLFLPQSIARPDMTAQRIELLARFAAFHLLHDFACGDLVEFKPGLSRWRPESEPTIAMMYWRPLDLTADADRKHAQAVESYGSDYLDCLVAIVSDTAASTIFLAACSAQLRPIGAADRRALHPHIQTFPISEAAPAAEAAS